MTFGSWFIHENDIGNEASLTLPVRDSSTSEETICFLLTPHDQWTWVMNRKVRSVLRSEIILFQIKELLVWTKPEVSSNVHSLQLSWLYSSVFISDVDVLLRQVDEDVALMTSRGEQQRHTGPVSCSALQSRSSSGSRHNQLGWCRTDRRRTKEALL